MNKKGQALVEFVIILPIFIYMIFVCIDMSKILVLENKLEGNLTNVILELDNTTDTTKIKEDLDLEEIEISVNKEQEYTKVTLTSSVDIITPGLNLIFGNPAKVEASRVIK